MFSVTADAPTEVRVARRGALVRSGQPYWSSQTVKTSTGGVDYSAG